MSKGKKEKKDVMWLTREREGVIEASEKKCVQVKWEKRRSVHECSESEWVSESEWASESYYSKLIYIYIYMNRVMLNDSWRGIRARFL